jgi:hypothetical protein
MSPASLPFERVKLLDFGLAKASDSADDATRTVVGVQMTADRTSGVAIRESRRSSVWVTSLGTGRVGEVVEETTAFPCDAAIDAAGRVFFAMRVPGGFAAFRKDRDTAPVQLLGGTHGPLSAGGRFVDTVALKDPRNILAQPIDGSTPVPVTHFTDKRIEDFSLSPDRRTMVLTRSVRDADVVQVTFKPRK